MFSMFFVLFPRRSGQQKERTTGGADSMSGGQRAGSVERGLSEESGRWSEEDIGRRGQPQWWTGQYTHLKGHC